MQFAVNNEVTRVVIWIAEQIAIPFGAVFVGAWFAFRNDRKKDVDAERERQLIAAHQLMFALLEQYQDLYNLRNYIGDIEPDHLLLTVTNAIRVNKQDLAFIVRKAPDELNEAVLAEHQYFQACDALVTYNEYTRQVHRFCKENAVGIALDGKIDLEFDVDVFPFLMVIRQEKTQAYEELKRAVDQGLQKNQIASENLRKLFQTIFKGERFLKISPPKGRGQGAP
jgi:hypothetical protein